MQSRQMGLTLIELMVAITLSLLIIAAAFQVYITATINARMQQASSDLQDNVQFGIENIKRHVRRANHGARASNTRPPTFLNQFTPQGGVILSESNLQPATLPPTWLSTAAVGMSHLHDQSSDQLTIQYFMPNSGAFDCQGIGIPLDHYVVERYFTRLDTTVSPNRLGLACASVVYQILEGGRLNNFQMRNASQGSIVIPNIDHFSFQLAVTNSAAFATNPESAAVGYVRLNSLTNNALANNQRVVGVRFALLAQSGSGVADVEDTSALRFDVLDLTNQRLTNEAATGPNYLREVYEATVLLRNARGGV